MDYETWIEFFSPQEVFLLCVSALIGFAILVFLLRKRKKRKPTKKQENQTQLTDKVHLSTQ
jgi:preprotein translocase subunit YajC